MWLSVTAYLLKVVSINQSLKLWKIKLSNELLRQSLLNLYSNLGDFYGFTNPQHTQLHAALYHIYKVPTNDEYLSVPVF